MAGWVRELEIRAERAEELREHVKKALDALGPRTAYSIGVGQDAEGRVELSMSDEEGKVFATIALHKDSIPDFVSTVLSITGNDKLGRDVAAMIRHMQQASKDNGLHQEDIRDGDKDNRSD